MRNILLLAAVLTCIQVHAQQQSVTGRVGGSKTAIAGSFRYWTGIDSVNVNYALSPVQPDKTLNIILHTPEPRPLWVYISDAAGRKVQEWKPAQPYYMLETTLNIAQLAPGDYVCHICWANDLNANTIPFQKKSR